MNKDPYDLTPVPKKDIFTYTDMTEEDFEDIVFNCFLEHAKQSFNYPEPAIDADGIFKFSRDLRAALAAANGPLQATTSKPLPVIPWSGSNLTEMEELLQKVQQLETENAALKDCLDWAETILCNSFPMQHSTLDEWNEIINKWRDSKHAIDAARKEAKP